MKIRQGFVSNSSSSSFVLVVKKETYDEIFANLSPLEQAVVEYAMYEEDVLGHECMVYTRSSDIGGNSALGENFDSEETVNRALEIANNKNITLRGSLEDLKERACEILWDVDKFFNDATLLTDGKVWSHDEDF